MTLDPHSFSPKNPEAAHAQPQCWADLSIDLNDEFLPLPKSDYPFKKIFGEIMECFLSPNQAVTEKDIHSIESATFLNKELHGANAD